MPKPVVNGTCQACGREYDVLARMVYLEAEGDTDDHRWQDNVVDYDPSGTWCPSDDCESNEKERLVEALYVISQQVPAPSSLDAMEALVEAVSPLAMAAYIVHELNSEDGYLKGLKPYFAYRASSEAKAYDLPTT